MNGIVSENKEQEKNRWEKSITTNNETKTIVVEEVENGYVITKSN